VTFEQAKRLKALGFDWINGYAPIPWYDSKGILHTDNFYTYGEEYFTVPTVDLVLQYFEQEKGIKNSIELVYQFDGIWGYKWKYIVSGDCNASNGTFETLQSTKNALLDELLTVFEEEK
jgi:hypothetical protein